MFKKQRVFSKIGVHVSLPALALLLCSSHLFAEEPNPDKMALTQQLAPALLVVPINYLGDLDNTPWPDAKDAVAVEVSAGSVVIFHDHMPHYSSANLSEHSRHAFTMHVSEKNADWPSENWLQRPTLGDFKL